MNTRYYTYFQIGHATIVIIISQSHDSPQQLIPLPLQHFLSNYKSTKMAYSCLVLLVLISCAAGNVTITIGHNGVNTEDCLTGSTNCSTLDYVLNSIQNVRDDNVTISVEYDHKLLAPVNVTYTKDTDIAIVGEGHPIIDCDGAYIFLYGQHSNSVSLTVDDISWRGCQAEGRALVGLAFDTLDVLTIANVQVSNCSDMVIKNVITATVTGATFVSNSFRYAVITFQVTSSFNDANVNVTNVLGQSSFSYNVGHSNSSVQSSTVAFLVNSTNENVQATFVCHNITFEMNYIYIVPMIHDNQVALIVPSANNIHSLKMSVTYCFFLSGEANVSKILYFFIEGAASQNTNLLIQNNIFINNRFNHGELTYIYVTGSELTNDSLKSLDILYCKNIARANTLTVGFKVEYEANYPAALEIVESTFEQMYSPAIQVICNGSRRMDVSIKDLLVFDCHMLLTAINPGLVDISYSNLAISDSNFMNNIGTALSLTDCKVTVTGVLQFTDNVGKNGGAMSVFKSTTLSTSSNATLIFTENSALYGGAIYTDSYDNLCFIDDTACNINFTMSNNSASTSGNHIFVVNPSYTGINCVTNYFTLLCASLRHSNFGSSVNRITLPSHPISVFPGENIFINASLYDAFMNPGTCVASVYLQCQDKVISCGKSANRLKLQGPTQLTMSNTPFYSNLILLATSFQNYSFVSPQLVFECYYTDPAFLNLHIKRECELGFIYNSSTLKCDCAFPNEDGYICSQVRGKACVGRGVWFGPIEQSGKEANVLGNCRYLLCNGAAQECPEGVGDQSRDYILLPSTSDEQCSDNRGGVLCSGCHVLF